MKSLLRFVLNRGSLGILGLLLLTSVVSGQAPQKMVEIEGITEYRLDNGVQLLLFPDASKPQVTFCMTVGVGSRHEGYGETGMAHLLEHMLFKGTPTYGDITELLKDRGVLNMNGTTANDRTNYYETLPAEEGNLEFLFHMESDRLVNSYIDGNELAKEMTVVRNEFESGEDSPIRILMQRIMANAYEWHNYGKTTIGNRTDIERVPVDRLRAFYRKYYRPDNIVVVVAGKFDEKKAIEYAQKYYGVLENPKEDLPKTYTEEPTQDGQRMVELRREGDVQVCGVGYHIPAASHPDFAACQVLTSIIGVEPAGRLYKNLVENEVAAKVYTQAIAGHDPGMMLAFCEVLSDGDLEAARKAMIASIEEIAVNGVSEEEVKRIVQKTSKRYERQIANSESLAISLSDWWGYGDWRLYFLHRDRAEKVTAADVQRVAQAYLLPSNRTVGLFLPTKEPARSKIPGTPNVRKMVADYKGREKIAEGEVFDPSTANIAARTEIGVFDSGVKYAMLPKKSRGERITVSGSLKYGTVESLNGKATACKLFPSMLTRGTSKLDMQQYRDRLDEIKTSINVSGTAGTLLISLSTDRDNFGDAMDLLHNVLRDPVWNEQRFEELKREQQTQGESMLTNPQALAGIALQRRLAPYEKGDPRHVQTLDEQLKSLSNVSLAELKAIYDEFVNGQNGQFTFVGDFDPELAKTKMENTLAGWTSDQPYERISTPVTAQEGERINIDTPDKANSVYLAALQAPLGDSSPDYEALEIANYILGGGSLSSRLADRIRKSDGLSYGVGSVMRASSLDERSTLMIYAISNPENTEKVVERVEEEVKRLLKDGVTEEELEKARESFIKTRQGKRANDASLAQTLQKNLEAGRSIEFQAASDLRFQNLTKAAVDQAFRKHMELGNLTIVTAGDFSKVESEEGEGTEEPEMSPKAEEK